jgi:hypothetical protein
MFALAFSSFVKGEGKVQLFRFTSPDAMSWTKGDDGRPQRIQFDLHDQTTGRAASNIDLFSCYYDDSDRAYPYKGWLWFANWGDQEGDYLVRSRDGKIWERGIMISRGGGRQLEQDGLSLRGPGDVTTFYHDKVGNRFLASLRFSSPQPIGPTNYLRARAYMFAQRLDEPLDLDRITRVELVPAAAARNGDLPHDEYYSSTAWRYESLWLGGLKVWHSGGDYPYSAAGCAFLKLAVSRDGLHWKKVQFKNDSGAAEVFMPNGKEGGNDGRNDGGYMTEFSQGPLRIGDDLIYYYGSSSFGKNERTGKRVSGGGIFRARLRPDRFVSVDSGTLTTRLLRFEGQHLAINAQGPVQVTVLSPDGRKLGTASVNGDSDRHAVKFEQKSLAGLLGSDGVVQLQFVVTSPGQLYSFRVE